MCVFVCEKESEWKCVWESVNVCMNIWKVYESMYVWKNIISSICVKEYMCLRMCVRVEVCKNVWEYVTVEENVCECCEIGCEWDREQMCLSMCDSTIELPIYSMPEGQAP